MLPQVQPVNAGATGSGETDVVDGVSVVVVVGGGTGPVNDSTSTNVLRSVALNVEPTAMQSHALTHDTEYSASSSPGLGLDITDHTVPFHCSTNVTRAGPVSV
jgi:hypothetical protein